MCSLERHGRVFVLKFLAEGEHRFTQALCGELTTALRTVEADSDARALVTTNDGRFYSNGLDLDWMRQQPRSRFPMLLKEFENVTLALMRLSVPTVAAVCGHAAAGGMLFAMAHDYRIMRRDRGFLYSSAIDINVVVPRGFHSLLRCKLTPQAFRDAVLGGRKFTAAEAFEAGAVDQVADDAAGAFEAAMAHACSLAEKPWRRTAYRGIRLAMYADAVAEIERDVREGLDAQDIISEEADNDRT